ncbi:tRNA (adenosine(37)-N6)-threonylcarbamoyltransferase complex ATPase subunit type 1 TsaE [Patescibacteria group bacterium]|nr:tRNA (adenosine(37)-N6)-threonylcarbamoyltransferase complex ATPase subunit type 1 TsaE [Patescibacteria group bacterium]
MKITTQSEKQTLNLGKKIAKQLKGGEVIGLIGELGAGKTVFIKGLAQGLNIKKTITSPTFVLMKVYPVKSCEAGSPTAKFNRVNPINNLRQRRICLGRKQSTINNFIHVDAYRLKSAQDLIDIGIKDYLSKKTAVTVIEWADQVKNILPKNRILVKIKMGRNPNQRIFEINNQYGKSVRVQRT